MALNDSDMGASSVVVGVTGGDGEDVAFLALSASVDAGLALNVRKARIVAPGGVTLS